MNSKQDTNPSPAQLNALAAAARNAGTAHMVKTATAKTITARGWATAEAGHRPGIWTIHLTPAGQTVVDHATPEQLDAAAADAFKTRRNGGRGHRFGGNR